MPSKLEGIPINQVILSELDWKGKYMTPEESNVTSLFENGRGHTAPESLMENSAEPSDSEIEDTTAIVEL